MIIRPAGKYDLDRVVELNNIEEKWVGKKQWSFFDTYRNLPFFYVIEDRSKVEGFIMAMDQNVDYDNENFLWFKGRFNDFLYIDRVIIDPDNRRNGFATALYGTLWNKSGNTPLVTEVSFDPLNKESMIFHDKFGFQKVGMFSADEKKECKMYCLPK